jgi:pectin methylesterase-like acyl-CoA thioesterase
MPGFTTAQQYASAIGDLKAIAAACCSAAVKTCCEKPFYVRFLSGRYAGRVYVGAAAACNCVVF